MIKKKHDPVEALKKAFEEAVNDPETKPWLEWKETFKDKII